MNAGIDDEPHRAEKLSLKPAEIAKRIRLVPARFFREPLGVKRPSFLVGGKRNELPELRHALEFLRGGDLPMMARHAFVIRQRGHAPFRNLGHVAQVRVKNAGPRAVHRRSIIVRTRRRGFLEDRHPLHFDPRFRHRREDEPATFDRVVDQVRVFGQRIGAAFVIV